MGLALKQIVRNTKNGVYLSSLLAGVAFTTKGVRTVRWLMKSAREENKNE